MTASLTLYALAFKRSREVRRHLFEKLSADEEYQKSETRRRHRPGRGACMYWEDHHDEGAFIFFPLQVEPDTDTNADSQGPVWYGHRGEENLEGTRSCYLPKQLFYEVARYADWTDTGRRSRLPRAGPPCECCFYDYDDAEAALYLAWSRLRLLAGG